MKCENAMRVISNADDLDSLPRSIGGFAINRHVRSCDFCRSELAGARSVAEQAQQFREISLPAALEAKIALALQESRSQNAFSSPLNLQENETMKTTVTVPASGWTLKNGQSLRLAGVMVCAALIGVFLVSHKTPRSLAFADVENALNGVSSAHWRSIVTQYDSSGKQTFTQVDDNWATLEPGALSRTNAAMPGSKFVDTDEGTASYDPSTKVLTKMKIPAGTPMPRVSETVKNLITVSNMDQISIVSPSPKGARQLELRVQGGDAATQPNWSSKPITVDGKAMTQFTRVITLPDGKTYFQQIVVDPSTKLIDNCQYTIKDPGGKVTESGSNDRFVYNQTPPSGTFIVSPPPGTKVKVAKPLLMEREISKDSTGVNSDVTKTLP